MTNKEIIIAATVQELIKRNGKTTTLEVKTILRSNFSTWSWTQQEISDTLDAFYKNGTIADLEYDDNGTYRTYYLIIPQPVQSIASNAGSGNTLKTSTQSISRTKAINLIKESKGRFFTVEFFKQDGTVRIMNGQVKKSSFQDSLGYIKVRESNGKKRQFHPLRLISVTINNVKYEVK